MDTDNVWVPAGGGTWERGCPRQHYTAERTRPASPADAWPVTQLAAAVLDIPGSHAVSRAVQRLRKKAILSRHMTWSHLLLIIIIPALPLQTKHLLYSCVLSSSVHPSPYPSPPPCPSPQSHEFPHIPSPPLYPQSPSVPLYLPAPLPTPLSPVALPAPLSPVHLPAPLSPVPLPALSPHPSSYPSPIPLPAPPSPVPLPAPLSPVPLPTSAFLLLA